MCKSVSRSQVPVKQAVNKPGVKTGNGRRLKASDVMFANTNTENGESTSESRSSSSNNYNIDNDNEEPGNYASTKVITSYHLCE